MAKESPISGRESPAAALASEAAAARSVEDLLVAVAALRERASRPARDPALAAQRPAAAGHRAAKPAPAPAEGGGPRPENGNPIVLVVEDDPKLLELMTATFRRAGYVAHGAENGRRALRMLDQVGPDLMVTDIVMPEMEGIATMLGARARRPDVGIIAISGGGAYGRGETYLGWAGQLGADEVLPKPFRMSALLAAARVVLAGRGIDPIQEEG